MFHLWQKRSSMKLLVHAKAYHNTKDIKCQPNRQPLEQPYTKSLNVKISQNANAKKTKKERA